MQNRMYCVVVLAALVIISSARAQVPLSGYFIARSECQAYQSIRKQTNPGNVTTDVDHAYVLVAKNRPSGSHYLIKMEAEPRQRWVAVGCGEHVVPVDVVTLPEPVEPGPLETTRYILAVSWQPGFCELHSAKPECQSQSEDRFDASHFTLHGLWPQPRGNMYCFVTPEDVARDKNKNWADLPELVLASETRQELDKVMPGTQSFLQRHEWTKHGTCYHGESPNKYFQDALNYMHELNRSDSAVRTLFSDHIGQEITASRIQDAFDETFGDGAGDKIKITCKRDGNRQLITEITIGLQGELDEISMSEALSAAPMANNVGCTGGIVDPVGLQ